MKLAAAASYFDRQQFSDAYSAAKLFKGQFDLYDDSKRDGLPTERRTFSTKACSSMPARRVVQVGTFQWIVGGPNPDYFDACQIRTGWVANQVEGLATVVTLSQAIAGTGGFTAYSARSWLKETKEISESSQVYAQYELVFASTEPIAANQIVTLNAKPHLVRATYAGQAGFTKALVDEISYNPYVSISWNLSSVIDPVTELFIGGTVTGAPALLLRWQSSFEYRSEASPKFVAGDEMLITRASDGTPKTGFNVTLEGASWRVLAIAPVGDCYRLHLRRV